MESTETSSSSSSSSSRKKIEQIEAAINQLIQSNQTPLSLTHHDEDRHLLTNLLSQLESLKGDGNVKLSEQSESVERNEAEMERKAGQTKECCCEKGAGAEDIVKELKKLERQNRTTHRLLSALIFVIVTWQISEVSLLLKLKEWLNHPLRSLGGVVTGALKPPQPDDKESSTNQTGLGFINPIG